MPERTAESLNLRITRIGYKITPMQIMIWSTMANDSEKNLHRASFSTVKEHTGNNGSVRQHIRSGQSLKDFELNQNPVLINKPYFIKFSIMSLLFTATRTTIQRLKRPA